MTETDEEFVARMGTLSKRHPIRFDPGIDMDDFARLFALARRGAEAEREISLLRQALQETTTENMAQRQALRESTDEILRLRTIVEAAVSFSTPPKGESDD